MTGNYHHGDLKTALMRHARRCIETGELESTSMRELARATGVSHTAAYRHFSDKQGLLDAIAEEAFTELLRDSRKMTASVNNCRARLLASGMAYINFGLKHPRLLQHMFSAASRPDAAPSLREVAGALFDELLGIVRLGQEAGAFRQGDPLPLARGCWALVHGQATLIAAGLLQLESDETAARRYAQHTIEIFLDGLASSRSTGSEAH